MIVASVSSYLVVRTQLYLKINKKKSKRNINIDLAVVASQSSERQFMTSTILGVSSSEYKSYNSLIGSS